MSGWFLNHHFVEHPCRDRGQRFGPALGTELVADLLRDEITGLLAERGIGYDPTGTWGEWLWCLGGPDLYRDQTERLEGCVDLIVNVCDVHRVISAHLYPYDLIAETGGSGPTDPRRATRVPLPIEAEAVVAEVSERTAAWLDAILTLPDRPR